MNKTKTNLRRFRVRRGNALVLAILTTMLLFIIGMAFLSSTMTERATTVTVEQDAILDHGIEQVIDRINEVLVLDVTNSTNPLNNEARNYDYPDAKNSWLASLEPEFDDGTISGSPPHYYWRHITDLWGRFQDWMPQSQVSWYDPDIYDDTLALYAQQTNSSFMDLFRVSENHVPIRVVLENEVIESPELNQIQPRPYDLGWPTTEPVRYIINGMRADADGDGMTDSRWTRIPDSRLETQDQWLWAAVRIVDNGGMLNINTAYRNPEDPVEGAIVTVNPQWDGTQLSHINLIPFRAWGDANPTLIPVSKMQEARYGSVITVPPFLDDYQSDIQYEQDVGIRVLNPYFMAADQIYQPFDIFDELELRNRYLMFSNVQPRCGTVWPVTFTPGPSGVGIKYPYLDAYLLSYAGGGNSIDNWFDKVKPDMDPPLLAATIGNYNRRHLATTYNFDRITRRGDNNGVVSGSGMYTLSGNRKVGIRLPKDGVGVHSGFSSSNRKTRYIKYVAGALCRGLPKDDKLIKARFGDYYTRETLAWNWAVNLIDAQDTYLDSATPPKNIDTPSVLTAKNKDIETKYYGVETLDILKKHTLCISKLGYVEISDNWGGGPPAPANKPPTGKYYAIELFNPDDTDTPGNDGQKNLADPDPKAPKFKIQVTNKDGKEKGTLDLTSGTISSSAPPGTNDTEVIIFVNETANTNGGGNPLDVHAETALDSETTPTEITPSDWFELEEGDKLVLLNTTLNDMPVDCVTVPAKLFASSIDDPNVIYRKLTFPGTNFLLPPPTDADEIVLDRFWQEAGLPNTQLGDALVPVEPPGIPSYGKAYNHLYPITGNSNPYAMEARGIEKVKLLQTNELFRTVGEVVNAFAIGYSTRNNTKEDTFEFQTLWQGLVDSLVAIKNLDEPIANQTPFADFGVAGELGSFGRIRLDDPVFMGFDASKTRQYANVFDMLTYFDPSNDLDINGDWVDNDGNPWTSNDPTNDDVDQDGDGKDAPGATGDNATDSNENKAWWYEQAIPGRININTAPWFVIAQLPWVSPELARAIVAYRDKDMIPGTPIDYATPPDAPNGDFRSRKSGMGLDLTTPIGDVREAPGFVNVWELINVTHDLTGSGGANYVANYDIRQWGRDFDAMPAPLNNNPVKAPPVNPGPFYSEDDAANDMEERDILFKRISNLVTVRSDVFTAYILVRIGRDGPQKRMIAIFDRSNVYSRSDTPKLVALHPVPDPR